MKIASVTTLLVAGLLGIGQALGQSFPSQTIRFVVPYGSGGSPDVMSRIIARKLAENIGQAVVVDNKPGASGIIAAEIAAKAAPDGYTLFIADTGHVAINPALRPKLPYDPVRDFTPVTLAVSTPLFLAATTKLPIHTVNELIAYAKANPGQPYGSSGNGSPHHLAVELLKLLTGVNLMHIPYKGVAQSVPALVSGEVTVIFAALPSLAPHIKSGKVRLLAVGTAQRTPIMPDVPTLAESGAPGFEIDADIGFLAPAGTPKDVVLKLNSEILKVLHDPEIKQRLVSLGIEATGTTPEQYAEAIRVKIQKYAKLVKDAGVRVD